MNAEFSVSADAKADSIYLRVKPDRKVSYSKEIAANVVLDYDSEGHIIGIDIQNAGVATPETKDVR